MENTISDVSDFIKRYKNVGNIRFTLGRYTVGFGFEKQIYHRGKYDLILKLLNSNPGWDDVTNSILEKNNNVTYKIIDTLIYKNEKGPYDLIITAESKKCQSVYISEDYVKNEINFMRKCHTFQISHESDVSNGDVFSFNLQLHKNVNSDTYNSHSSLLKIIDIIKVVDSDKTGDYVFEKL